MKKKLYAIILEDRHTDVKVEVYDDLKDAITEAQRVAVEEYDYDASDPDQGPQEVSSDCFYNCHLSHENDYISVQEIDYITKGTK